MLPSRGHHCLGTDLFLFGIMSALHRARTGISRTAAAVYGVGHCWDESHLALRKRTRHDSQCPTAWYLQLSIHALSVYRHSCHERPFSEDPIALSTFLANHSLRSEVCVRPRLIPCKLAYYQTLTVYRPLKKKTVPSYAPSYKHTLSPRPTSSTCHFYFQPNQCSLSARTPVTRYAS
jgi:hypothetical protein